MNDLLILGLRDSAQNHAELTRQLSPETHEAAKHYYSLICAEYCELMEKSNQEELANA